MKTPVFFRESIVLSLVLTVIVIVPLCILSQKFTRASDHNLIANQLPLKAEDTGTEEDKTLSPYFFVKGSDGVDQMPLKSTAADVLVSGVIADVTVRQVYINTGKSPLEAVYVFPASARAAVYRMTMRVGDRLLTARIEEKQKAREEYQEALNQGRTASLLEQQRPNIFQMNVANILPGDTITVEMCYTELLIPESGVYEWVYPTVVGPRYSNKNEETAAAGDKWVSNPYTHQGVAPSYSFDCRVRLNAGMPIRDISCPSHKMNIRFGGSSLAELSLSPDELSGGNRDLIVQYRLSDQKIGSGLILHCDEASGENFFLAMLQPPARPADDIITPREYIFIVDVSGSMNGFPIEVSKKLLRNLVSGIRTTDKFNVLLFAGTSRLFAPQSVYATSENLEKALRVIDEQNGSGGTELLTALRTALTIEKQQGFSRTFVIATDGYVDVEKESFELIRNNLNKANFFAFGIGSSVNRFLIEGIAHAGMGEAFVVTDASVANEKADKFRKYIANPVLTAIKVEYDGFNVYDVEPVAIPDVLAERPVIIFGKFRGKPGGKINISGMSGKRSVSYTIDIEMAGSDLNNPALRTLWARQRVSILSDYNQAAGDQALRKEITELGLKYNLLTEYTSFVAIDSLVRNKGGKQTTVKQPLPAPQGVSDLAVGGPVAACKVSNIQINCMVSEYRSPTAEDVAYLSVETMPEFMGGSISLNNFLSSNIIYPEKARKAGLSGTVYVSFVVEPDGSVSEVKVVRGVGSDLDAEAVRVVKKTKGRWIPGEMGGVKVRVQMTLPVMFKLN